MKRKKRQGIVLITTLLFVTIIVMIATMVAAQGKAALQSGAASMQAEEAYMAALSGIEVVRGELKKEKTFGTYSFSGYKQRVANKFVNGLKIEYNDKDIVGYIGATDADKDNYKSKFTISFKTKFSSTSSTASGKYDANYKHSSSDCKYLSVNNIASASTVDQDINKGIRREVPAYSCYIVSKGVCGKAVRYAEAFLISDGPVAVDSGSTIGGTIKITGEGGTYKAPTKEEGYTDGDNLLTVKHVDNKYAGQLNAYENSIGDSSNNKNAKCNNKIALYENYGAKKASNLGNLEKLLNLSNKVNMNGKLENNPNQIQDENLRARLTTNDNTTVNKADLDSLTFEEAKKTVNSTSEANKLNSGSYLYVRDIDNKGKITDARWVYVDNQNLTDGHGNLNGSIKNNLYKNQTQTPQSTGISFGVSDNPEEQSRTVVLSDNVEVDNNVNFAVVDHRTGNRYSLSNATVDFQLASGGKSSLVSNGGNINIYGEVTGNGNLIAKNNISFNAGSEIEVAEDQKVAVWAGEDVYIGRAKNVSRSHFGKLGESFRRRADLGEVSDIVAPQVKTEEEIETGVGAKDANEAEDSNIYDTSFEGEGLVTSAPSGFEELTNPYNGNLMGYTFQYNGKTYCFKQFSNDNSSKNNALDDNKFQVGEITGFENDMPIIQSVKSVQQNGGSSGVSIGDIKIFPRTGSVNDRKYNDYNLYLKVNGKYYFYTGFDNDSNGITAKSYNIGNSSGKPNDSEYGGSFSESLLAVDSEADKNINYGDDNISSNNNDKDTMVETAQAVKEGRTVLRGTVYSQNGDINISIGDTKFEIIGALISTNGDLNITAKHVDLTYDPNYVPFFKDIGINTNVKFLSSFVGGE